MNDKNHDEDITNFINELKKTIYDLSKKHSLVNFPVMIAVPITMLHRCLQQWEKIEAMESATDG